MRKPFFILALAIFCSHICSQIAAAQAPNGAAAVGATYLCVDYNSYSPFPTISHQCGRSLDAPNVERTAIQSAPTTFSWTNFDLMTANMFANNVQTLHFVVGRVPNFASSSPYDPTGSHYASANSSAQGTGSVNGTAFTASTGSLTAGSSLTGLTWIGGNGTTMPYAPFTITVIDATHGTLSGNAGNFSGISWGVNGASQTGQQMAGQNDPPSDITTTGGGTNDYFREWIAALASHVNANCPGASCYYNSHARLHIYETQNEYSSSNFWTGTVDQMVRMEWDMRCIVKGCADLTTGATFTNGSPAISATNAFTVGQAVQFTTTGTLPTNFSTGTIYYVISTGLSSSGFEVASTRAGTAISAGSAGSGSQSVLAPGNPVTGETQAQVLASITQFTVTSPIDPTATILMPSVPSGPTGVSYIQAFLYGTGSACGGNSCTLGSAGANGTDAVLFHEYWCSGGCTGSSTMENTFDSYMTSFAAVLQTAETSKPWLHGEGQFSSSGWGALTDTDMQAAYVARYNIYPLCHGITENVWYDWLASNGLGLTAANLAFSESYSWLLGASVPLPVTSSCVQTAPGTVGSGLHTYTVALQLASGTLAAAIWDTSQSCSGGVCGTTNQTVANMYTSYVPLTGGAPQSIVSHQVAVGIKPILLLSSQSAFPVIDLSFSDLGIR